MKLIKLNRVNALLVLCLTLGSCNRTPDIFTAGFGYGMFAILAILVVVAFLIMKARNK